MIRRMVFGVMLAVLMPTVSACAATHATKTLADVTQADEYRLGGGDDLRILVYGEPTLSGEYHVNSLGTVSMPMIGEVKAEGLTLPAFQAALAAAFEGKGLLTKANISVDLLTYRPFFILGEVNMPGQYPFVPHMNVQQAIATAKGFTYRAKHNVILVTHAGETHEVAYTLSAGAAVQPGDTIRIPERHF